MKKVERFLVQRITGDGRCLFRALVLFNIYFLIVKIISTISYGNLFFFQSRCWLFKLVFESSLPAAIKALHELLCPWASPSSEQPSSSHLSKVSSQSVVGATTSYETTSFSSVVEVPNLLYLSSSSSKVFFFFPFKSYKGVEFEFWRLVCSWIGLYTMRFGILKPRNFLSLSLNYVMTTSRTRELWLWIFCL